MESSSPASDSAPAEPGSAEPEASVPTADEGLLFAGTESCGPASSLPVSASIGSRSSLLLQLCVPTSAKVQKRRIGTWLVERIILGLSVAVEASVKAGRTRDESAAERRRRPAWTYARRFDDALRRSVKDADACAASSSSVCPHATRARGAGSNERHARATASVRCLSLVQSTRRATTATPHSSRTMRKTLFIRTRHRRPSVAVRRHGDACQRAGADDSIGNVTPGPAEAATRSRDRSAPPLSRTSEAAPPAGQRIGRSGSSTSVRCAMPPVKA